MYIPSIGVTGLWSLKAPLDTVLLPNTAYTCIAVRKLSDVMLSNIDPIETYYTPLNLTQKELEADLSADACIVTLQAVGSILVYIPSTYIQAYPDIGGVYYTNYLMGMDLGALPTNINLDYLKNKMAELVYGTLGVMPTITEVAASAPLLIADSKHEEMEGVRKGRISILETDYSKYINAQEKLTQALEKIKQLEKFIHANMDKLQP